MLIDSETLKCRQINSRTREKKKLKSRKVKSKIDTFLLIEAIQESVSLTQALHFLMFGYYKMSMVNKRIFL